MASKWGNDYPEHLNPFNDTYRSVTKKKRSNSFSETLRGFKSTLRKSFRGKKPDKYESAESSPVLLRNPNTLAPTNRHTLPTEFQRPPPMALPRSRFKERLAKSGIHDPEDAEYPHEIEAPVRDEKRIRRKKRAPPPPRAGSIPEELDSKTLQVPQTAHSKWSLTSGETDASYCSDDDNVDDINETNNQIQEMLQQITRDMEKLTDDTNNNVVTIEAVEIKLQIETDIPDVVVSCVNDVNDNEVVEDTHENVANKIMLFEQQNLKMIDDDDGSEENSPVPKLRRHKLTKNNLLGTDSISKEQS